MHPEGLVCLWSHADDGRYQALSIEGKADDVDHAVVDVLRFGIVCAFRPCMA
jgi:hypothetical protein